MTVVPMMGILRSMRLADYMDKHGLDDPAMAGLIGDDVSAWAVRKWRYGQRVPRRDMQKRIERVTEGVVTTADLFAAADEVAERARTAPTPQDGAAA